MHGCEVVIDNTFVNYKCINYGMQTHAPIRRLQVYDCLIVYRYLRYNV